MGQVAQTASKDHGLFRQEHRHEPRTVGRANVARYRTDQFRECLLAHSGAYYVRMTTDTQVDTRKVMLLK
jgi:hypothetical protein